MQELFPLCWLILILGPQCPSPLLLFSIIPQPIGWGQLHAGWMGLPFLVMSLLEAPSYTCPGVCPLRDSRFCPVDYENEPSHSFTLPDKPSSSVSGNRRAPQHTGHPLCKLWRHDSGFPLVCYDFLKIGPHSMLGIPRNLENDWLTFVRKVNFQSNSDKEVISYVMERGVEEYRTKSDLRACQS